MMKMNCGTGAYLVRLERDLHAHLTGDGLILVRPQSAQRWWKGRLIFVEGKDLRPCIFRRGGQDEQNRREKRRAIRQQHSTTR